VALDGARGDVWRAVALQAHWMGGGKTAGRPIRRGRSAGDATAASDSPAASERSSAPSTTSSANRGGLSTSEFPVSAQRRSSNEETPPSSLSRYADLDYDEKVRRHDASLTLAQRLGLVAEPSKPLTHEQWDLVKKSSDSREDSGVPCSICLEDFRERAQVILSCSHVLHAECLRSFEKFSGSRRCPLCRCPSYDVTPHFSGFQVWRQKCASRIQRAWRGYRERTAVFNRLKQPDVRAEAPTLHRRLCGRALQAAGGKLAKVVADREDALDRFLEELDSSMVACALQLRDGLSGLEQLHGLPGASVETPPSSLEPASAGPQALSGGSSARGEQRSANKTPPAAHDADAAAAEMWAKARRSALDRGSEVDCPICFQECHLRGPGCARVELLSCSHVFHRCCIMSFESFHVFEVHICPVCRQKYDRRPWQHSVSQRQGKVALSEASRPPRPPPPLAEAANARRRPPREGAAVPARSGHGSVNSSLARRP